MKKMIYLMLLFTIVTTSVQSQNYLENWMTGNYSLSIFSDDTYLMVTTAVAEDQKRRNQNYNAFTTQKTDDKKGITTSLMTIGRSESLQKSQLLYVNYLIATDNVNIQTTKMFILRNQMLRTDNKL